MTDLDFIALLSISQSYGEAAAAMGVHLNTVATRAKALGVGKANGGKREEFELQDILDGHHPQYPTIRLKKRLVKAGMLNECCATCGIHEWLGKKLVLDLDHINGVRSDHRLENLRLLCPNCHSQTPTYKSKNK